MLRPRHALPTLVLSFFLLSSTAAQGQAFSKRWCGSLLYLAGTGVDARPVALPSIYLTKPFEVAWEKNPPRQWAPRILLDLPDPAKIWTLADGLAANEFLMVSTDTHFFREGRPFHRFFWRRNETNTLLLARGRIYQLTRLGTLPHEYRYRVEVLAQEPRNLPGAYLALSPAHWNSGPEILNPFGVPVVLPLSQARPKHAGYRFTATEAGVDHLLARLDGAAIAPGMHVPTVDLAAEDFATVRSVGRQRVIGGVDRVSYTAGLAAVGVFFFWLTAR